MSTAALEVGYREQGLSEPLGLTTRKSRSVGRVPKPWNWNVFYPDRHENSTFSYPKEELLFALACINTLFTIYYRHFAFWFILAHQVHKDVVAFEGLECVVFAWGRRAKWGGQ